MVPDPKFKRQCDRQYTVGTEYTLAVFEPRSQATHGHYFASVQDGWHNLPYGIAERFPTSEHLRRWCLVHEGFCDEKIIVCDTEKDAKSLAILARQLDEYAVISLAGNIVTIWTAKSQSVSAMDKDEFRQSKEKVLARISEMVGTSSAKLQDNARKTT